MGLLKHINSFLFLLFLRISSLLHWANLSFATPYVVGSVASSPSRVELSALSTPAIHLVQEQNNEEAAQQLLLVFFRVFYCVARVYIE